MIGVTVMRDRYVRSWPLHEHGERAFVLPLGQALEREYRSDAHFAAYATPNNRRLKREALDRGLSVELTSIVFDVDCEETHGTTTPAPEEWRAELREKVDALASVHINPYFYETRGGARLVYAQHEPTVIRTQLDAVSWRQTYAIAIAYLERRFSIIADPACSDWQRLYRLPHATRSPGGNPEKWVTSGKAGNIGKLLIDHSAADIQLAKGRSKAFAPRRALTFTPSPAAGDGLLYHLLRSQGSLIREHSNGAFVVRCPAESEHSTGTTGDGSTLLYLPAAGHEIGAIHCLHGHCAGRSLRDWLRLFSGSELESARTAAGIVRRRVA